MLSRGAPAHLALNLFGKFILGTLQIVLHWRPSQKSGVVPRYCASRSAVSAVMARLPFTISRIRFGATCRSSASWLILVPGGAMKSSRRIAPRLLGARLNVALNLRLVFPRCGAQIVGAL